jgi:AraC-like DNA-binding protein
MTPFVTGREYNVHGPRIRLLYAEQKDLGRWRFDDLCAPYFRLYQQSSAGGWVDFGEGPVALEPDSLYLIPPQTSFRSGAGNDLRQFYVHFTLDPEEGIPSGGPLPLRIPLDTHLENSLHLLWSEEQPVAQALLLEAFVRTVLARAGFRSTNEILSTRMETAQELLRRHLGSGISNAELAAALHMSEKAFVRWFRSEAGIPPQAWLTRERVLEAAVSLHHTDISIERIAEQYGFCDRHYFSRVFKKHQGVAPGTFRRNRERLPVR